MAKPAVSTSPVSSVSSVASTSQPEPSPREQDYRDHDQRQQPGALGATHCADKFFVAQRGVAGHPDRGGDALVCRTFAAAARTASIAGSAASGSEKSSTGFTNKKRRSGPACASPASSADQSSLAEMGGGLGVPCDVTDAAQVDALFERVVAEYGRLDVLFNNAGSNVASAPIGDIAPEDFRKVMETNLYGAFLCARGAFNVMRAQDPQGGRIINNGSISAYVPRPGSAPYTSSKHAITGLTRSISLDGRPYGIACGQIDIGNTASDMTARMGGGVPQADGSIKPEPVMSVENVANTVLMMADLPPEANIQFVTVMATNMPYIGRG